MDDYVPKLHSLEAEQSVIGGLCIDGQCIDDVIGVVKPSDFFFRQYRMAFEAFKEMAEAGQQPEMIGVADALSHREDENWLQFLATLAKNTPSTANIKLYAGKVSEYARLRDLYLAGMKVQDISQDHSLSLLDRIASAQDVLIGLEAGAEEKGPRFVGDLAKGYVQHLDECYKAKGGITGLSTGFDSLDRRTGGLKPGNLITIAARPAMGKTQLAVNLSRRIAIDQDKTVLYFSLEMTHDELMGRMVSDMASVDYGRVQMADFDETERHTDAWPRITMAMQKFRGAKLAIDDDAGLTIGQLVSRARKFHRQNQDLALIVVDHIGLVESDGETETIRIGRISRALKKLAKQLGVPIIILSQLNRECEKRSNSRPILADLRSSGDIEQDSDVVGFIYRDIVYNENTQHPEIAELIWRKVRAGQIGTDYFRTEFHFCRFLEADKPSGIDEDFKSYSQKRRTL